LIDNSIYSGKPKSQVVFFRRSLRKLYKYKRLYNNNMHAGYMRCIYLYTRRVLKYRTKIIIYYKEELFAKCVRLYYGDLRIAV
jgi:hypothetical protein